MTKFHELPEQPSYMRKKNAVKIQNNIYHEYLYVSIPLKKIGKIEAVLLNFNIHTSCFSRAGPTLCLLPQYGNKQRVGPARES